MRTTTLNYLAIGVFNVISAPVTRLFKSTSGPPLSHKNPCCEGRATHQGDEPTVWPREFTDRACRSVDREPLRAGICEWKDYTDLNGPKRSQPLPASMSLRQSSPLY